MLILGSVPQYPARSVRVVAGECRNIPLAQIAWLLECRNIPLAQFAWLLECRNIPLAQFAWLLERAAISRSLSSRDYWRLILTIVTYSPLTPMKQMILSNLIYIALQQRLI
ncbi:MAG: hypothetical protein P0Y55_12585 [Candidatus Cohnella colombiensis]|uniref:Uncharacterized protein n=1 Tax=Candidatus Cohnella colombiensis TaxID=3121368 RepID=A0AA95EY12_9BACL|nr:MAG: hypothetical protein P0Y55_12585 [Cohnella sp.]